MRFILLCTFAALVITKAFCEENGGGVTTENSRAAERARLKDSLMKALEQNDTSKLHEIDRIYRFQAGAQSWLTDAEPLHNARYEALKNLIGTEREREPAVLDGIARICAYVRKAGASSLFSKLEKDYKRANPYAFPEILRMAGWPEPGDQHQLKGVQGQILATMVAVKGKDFLKEHIRTTAALAADSNEKLLGIWALGYAVFPEASDYLKGVAVSGSDREKALARSALKNLTMEMNRDSITGKKIDKDQLANLKKFLTEHGIGGSVTAGEYYPF